MASLESKVAIITGAAGGFGKAVARAFLKAGASIIICDLNASMLEEARAELSSLGSIEAIAADMTEPSTAPSLVHEAVKKFGKLDILVNNVGIMDRFDPIGDVDMDF